MECAACVFLYSCLVVAYAATSLLFCSAPEVARFIVPLTKSSSHFPSHLDEAKTL
jgi:hypothetical protein